MAQQNFSKKICHELLLFEDYLHSCKNAPLQKDKIIVDKEKTLEIIETLRAYHCADRDGKKGDNEAPKVTTFIKADNLPEIPKVKNKKEYDKAVIDLNKELAKKREEAYAELTEEINKKRKEEEDKLLAKVKNAQKIADQALAQNNAAKKNEPTLPMPEKNPKLAASDEEAKRIISEAQIKADYMLSQAETKAYMKQEEVDKLLSAKIAEAEKKAEEIIKNAHDEADGIMAEVEQRAADMTTAGLKKAADFVEQAEHIYKQQLEVLHNDREDIVNILKQFDTADDDGEDNE